MNKEQTLQNIQTIAICPKEPILADRLSPNEKNCVLLRTKSSI
ncbi:hypothetical protein PRABACTJOHN_03711 [Parabacteroides johnsonii DSM 18315]|uniref:Uncharacterized protein n=1 Tax=Parabacteroides johnsonii DSM 18315 TaxID=537006 RepID=B7BF82_9BACT|nr:hypothetical protein PRABACTJOHN_03711 [Parabacteroides johnsonii DSM 18315]